MSVTWSPNEEERLRILQSLSIMETSGDPRYMAICRRAARDFNVPIALVSLVDRDRQWFKASCGLDVRETPRDWAFCSHAIQKDEVMVVEDALKDERFLHNPLVLGPPYIRFYAGAPLHYGEGIKLGTLCVIDTRPRQINLSERQHLEWLASRVASEIWVDSATTDPEHFMIA